MNAGPRAPSQKTPHHLHELIPAFREPKRCQGYFVWSWFVVRSLRGTNKALEAALDEVFASSFSVDGQTFPALPNGNLDDLLADYYLSMELALDA